MAIFKGAGVAIVTPMHEDGTANFDKLEEMIEFQIQNSTDAIIITGTTGESSTLIILAFFSCIFFNSSFISLAFTLYSILSISIPLYLSNFESGFV